MEYTVRRLGEPIPTRILINKKGQLSMVDGSSVEEYLASWYRARGFKGKVPVGVLDNDSSKRLEQTVVMMNSWGS